MSYIYSFIFDGIEKVITQMKDFEIFTGVSLFYFLIALTVMSIVITYLVNVARSPGITTSTEKSRRVRRKSDD